MINYFLFLFFWSLAGYTQIPEQNGTTCVKIESTYELYAGHGKCVTTRTLRHLYKTNEYNIFKEFYTMRGPGQESTNPDSIKYSFLYYIADKNNLYGMCFDPKNAKNKEIYNVDSLIDADIKTASKFYRIDKGSKSEINRHNDYIEEKIFVRKGEQAVSSVDSVSFIYTKKKVHSPFYNVSSHILDHNLVKIVAIFDEIPAAKSPDGFLVPKRKFVFEISNVSLTDYKDVNEVIKRYQTEMNQKNLTTMPQQ